ncbi:MAG: group II intron reverse transcriptase/maturase [Planctomycetota bacterium]
MPETPSSENVSTRLRYIAKLAREMPGAALTSLSHHIDVEWLREAWRRTRKDAAVGVDGQTAQQYAADLEGNLRRLLDRAKSGTYHAPPVRRVHIPKGTGNETRPIGIPTLEDKILQRAVAMVLEAVYEQDFMDCSYGFRPGRSAHQALAAFWRQAMDGRGGWLIEVDIRRFFDTLDHGRLREILRRRVRDGVLLRLLGKWLNAGVLEAGSVSYPEAGTPQGGVISPLLANIYLHEVLDVWLERRVKPRLQGRVVLIRYADDFVLLFSCEADARAVLEALPRLFAVYGLTVHPTKTRLVDFRQPPYGRDPDPPPGSFDLLGFTHFWGKSLKGGWIVMRRTAKDRFTRALRRVAEWCREHRHLSLREQHQGLSTRLRGHYGYFGITGNLERLKGFRFAVTRRWQKWLDRRSFHGRMTWERFARIEAAYALPRVVVFHSIYRPVASP